MAFACCRQQIWAAGLVGTDGQTDRQTGAKTGLPLRWEVEEEESSYFKIEVLPSRSQGVTEPKKHSDRKSETRHPLHFHTRDGVLSDTFRRNGVVSEQSWWSPPWSTKVFLVSNSENFSPSLPPLWLYCKDTKSTASGEVFSLSAGLL